MLINSFFQQKKNKSLMIMLLLGLLLCFSGCMKKAKTTTEEKPIEVQVSEEEAHRAELQSINLTGVDNARQLGGYKSEDGRTVKSGVLLRSAALNEPSEEDIQKLQETFHLSEVIDLRMSNEVEEVPDVEIPGVKNLHIGIIDEADYKARSKKLHLWDLLVLLKNKQLGKLELGIKMGVITDQMYVEYLSSDRGKEGYRQMFEELLNLPEGDALLFHCTKGKDRTGVAAMLILSALDVDEKTIMEDFLLTNTFSAEQIAKDRQMLIDAGYEGEKLNAMMTGMWEVDPVYMENALTWMKENYGSSKGYITKELGITQEQMDSLKDKYLNAEK